MLRTQSNPFRNALIVLFFVSAFVFGGDIKRSVVQIFNESATPNFDHPWQLGLINSSSGSGVIIKGNRIVTAAHVVDNSLSIMVRKVGSDKRYKATAAYISDDRDLALLRIDDNTFFNHTEPLAIGQMPDLGETVITLGFPSGGTKLAITKGIISRIDFSSYSHSRSKNIVAQIDAAINSGSSGGPALVNGNIAGISFQGLSRANNVGYIIPAPVLQQFLDDVKDGIIHGVPEIAISIQKMDNEQLQQMYGLSDNQSGVLIVKLSGIEKELGFFRENDVILRIDGVSIGFDGTIASPNGDRIEMDSLLTRRQVGDIVPIEILRDKKQININYPLNYSRNQALIIPQHTSGYKPEYIIVGGIIFQEACTDYMDWKYNEDQSPPTWMLNKYSMFKEFKLSVPERLVFVSSILPDEINYGYEFNDYTRVKTVNGAHVLSIADIRAKLSRDTNTFIRIEFDPYGVIVFNKADIAKRDPIIKGKYNIP